MPPEPKKRPAQTKKVAKRPATTKARPTQVQKKPAQQKRPTQVQKKPAQQKRPTQAINKKAPPAKKAAAAPTQSSTSERSNPAKKKSGFFGKIIKLAVFIGICAVGYFGYLLYGAMADKEFSTETLTKALKDTTKEFKSNTTEGYNKIKAQGQIVWDSTAKQRLEFMDYTKDSWNDLEKKVKELGEVSTSELGNMADGYLDDFSDMVETTDDESNATGEKHVIVAKDYTQEILDEKQKAKDAKEQKETLANQEKEPKKDPTPKKEPVVEITNSNFDEMLRLRKEKRAEKERKRIAAEKPKEIKPSNGFQQVGSTSGAVNQNNIDKKPAPKRKPKMKAVNQSDPAHMKEYYKARKDFMVGLSHYKKASPSSNVSEGERIKQNKLAFISFKKASKVFSKIAPKMEGHKEFEKISVDTFRFIHACGKSMLIN